MRGKTIILLIAALLATIGHAYVEEDGSLILTELDFHTAIKEFKNVLVNFHALWCRYSKKLKPEWNNLAESLKKEDSSVKLAKVEAYDEKKLAEEFDIEGYPTIKMFINGVPHDYNGERVETHLHEFIDRKLKNPLHTAENAEWVKKMLFEYEWIGLYNGNDESAVKDVAFDLGDVLFVKATDSSFKDTYGLNANGFVLVNNITKSHDAFSGDLNAQNLKKFVEDHKFPAVPRFSKGTAERIFLSEEPSMILIRKSGDSGDQAENNFKEAQKELNGKIFMSVALYDEEIGRLLAENLGVAEADLPDVRIVKPDMEKIKKWATKEPITKNSIVKFYNDFLARKAQRAYVSEPVPTENKDLVLKVVGQTFEKEVLNPEKDVLIMFWAPWCGHCRAMMPVYDNVARKTKPMAHFTVAKIDMSVNELDGFGIDIVEYPTILLFTKADKANPIEFKGERNEYVFNDFIRAHASVPLDGMKGPNPFDKNEL
jgi:protein disulfide-isomerase A1